MGGGSKRKRDTELLAKQDYRCAGCGTALPSLSVTRTCEYTAHVFCKQCHSGAVAVLPARILHLWDFKPVPVSNEAKDYLEAIADKPLLDVSAINPQMFRRVKELRHARLLRLQLAYNA